jgi:hypothetical protein
MIFPKLFFGPDTALNLAAAIKQAGESHGRDDAGDDPANPEDIHVSTS